MAKRFKSDEELRASLRERLAAGVVISASGCHEWQRSLQNKGYGKISFRGKRPQRAHRMAYALHHDLPIPFDGVVCHTCDNRKCVNPEHLFLGTIADNNRDMVRKGRQSAPKLTAAVVRAIRADTRPHGSIAKDYGVTRLTIRLVKARERWAHVI